MSMECRNSIYFVRLGRPPAPMHAPAVAFDANEIIGGLCKVCVFKTGSRYSWLRGVEMGAY